MVMITAQQAAEKWGLSLRSVQNLCRKEKIPGARRFGKSWMIPTDASRPVDGRSKEAKAIREYPARYRPLLRRTPFLNMTDLYSVPGSADECVQALARHPEEQALFEAEIAYSRGDIDTVYRCANYFLEQDSGYYAMLGGGMLLSLCAMWRGDLELWRKARLHVYHAPCSDDAHRDIVRLTLAAMDSAIRDTQEFPEWFKRGCFEGLPEDAHPAAWVYYVKYLLVSAQDVLLGRIRLEGVDGFGLLKTIPYVAGPLISKASAEQIVMAELYLRLLCAIACQQSGDRKRAAEHLDRAIALALPDRLYGVLVEHRRQLGQLLDERLQLADPAAAKRVRELYKQFHAGWVKLHNGVLERTVSTALSQREREIARLAAFGLTNSQIARQLHISEHSVKAQITSIRNKTGAESRADLGAYV